MTGALRVRNRLALQTDPARIRTRRTGRVGGFLLLVAVSGCATYHPLPLAQHASLAPALNALDTRVPAVSRTDPPETIDTARPLSIAQIGLLAVLNDPDLRAEWGKLRVAQAGLLQTTLLPNPSVGLGFAALLSGPGSTPSYAASLSQDIAALVTYHARIRAARAHVAEVNAALLWQEWQVAQKARLLGLNIYYGERSIALTGQELHLVSDEVRQAQAATAAGNLALTALAPLLAAKASAEQALLTLNTRQMQDGSRWMRCLGCNPTCASPSLGPGWRRCHSRPLIDRLPDVRPDLVALRLGYRSIRSHVPRCDPRPVPRLRARRRVEFGHLRRAIRRPDRYLRPADLQPQPGQYQPGARHAAAAARAVPGAAGRGGGCGARPGGAGAQPASRPAPVACRGGGGGTNCARTARAAYAQGNLDQRSLTDYETTALQRALEVVDLERSIGADRITLAIELAIGLPAARIAPPDRTNPRMMRSLLRIGRIAIVLPLLATAGHAQTQHDVQQPSVLVQLTRLDKGRLPRIVTAYGRVQANASAQHTVMAPLSAVVQDVYVRPGETVAKGAALLRLMPSPSATAAYTQADSASRVASELVVRTRRMVASTSPRSSSSPMRGKRNPMHRPRCMR